ncbi:MAG: endonuclease domain-containing protein [Candidatus Omnitrophica bacterium]|nr:endonuclease domain-containing protein [Candidatus Omnitrophota bacterium]
MPKRPNIDYCRDLRKEQTDAEKLIWLYVRNQQIKNIKFRRQFSIGNYIIDFYAPSIKLAIEIDGGQHYEDIGERKDKTRSKYLESQGIKILRFANNDVLINMDGVYEVIENKIEEIIPSS